VESPTPPDITYSRPLPSPVPLQPILCVPTCSSCASLLLPPGHCADGSGGVAPGGYSRRWALIVQCVARFCTKQLTQATPHTLSSASCSGRPPRDVLELWQTACAARRGFRASIQPLPMPLRTAPTLPLSLTHTRLVAAPSSLEPDAGTGWRRDHRAHPVHETPHRSPMDEVHPPHAALAQRPDVQAPAHGNPSAVPQNIPQGENRLHRARQPHRPTIIRNRSMSAARPHPRARDARRALPHLAPHLWCWRRRTPGLTSRA
jgi:hypothetical protein